MSDITSADVNIVIIGDPQVGKTSITDRFVQGSYSNHYISTTGIDFNAKVMDCDGTSVSVNIWDTSGEQNFAFAAKKQISQADGYIFVYDVTSVESFNSLKHWLLLVQNDAPTWNLPKVLVGNKSDMRHKQVIGASRAKEFGIPEGMKHVEVSARLDKYINVIFYVLVTEILRYRKLGTIISIGLRSDLQAAYHEALEADATLMQAEHIEDTPEYQLMFRILLVGAPRVGKTSLRLRYCKNHFNAEYVPTAGFDYSTKCLMVDGARVKVQLWDVSGDAIYEQTRRSYYMGADAFVILFDVTNSASFEKAELLLKDLNMIGCDKQLKFLIGNKLDSKRHKVVTYQSAKDFAEGWRLGFMETSARYGDNVDSAFSRLIVALKRQHAPWRQVYDFSGSSH